MDLPSGTTSGLRVVREILDEVEDVHFSILTSTDVVRHRLVGEIVDAYGRWDAVRQAPAHERSPSEHGPVERGPTERGRRR